MLLILAAVLGVLWLLGFVVFHVSTAAIHLVLVAAIGVALFHLVRGTGRGLPGRHHSI